MKQLHFCVLVILTITLASCKDRCFDDLPGVGVPKYEYLSLRAEKGNNEVYFENCAVIEPSYKPASVNRIPLSVNPAKIKLIVKQPNQPWDTLEISYQANISFNNRCKEAYYSTGNFMVTQSTLDTSIRIYLKNPMY
jgi:hypothetical protein